MADNSIFKPNETKNSLLTETSPPVAQALSLNQAQDPFKINGVDTYVPNPMFTIGGEGFMETYNDFVTNPEKNIQKRTIEAFLNNNAAIDERNKGISTMGMSPEDTSPRWIKEGVAEAYNEKVKKNKHPLGLFFEQYGRDVTSVYSGIALDIDRTNHYMQRWKTQDPVTKKSTMDTIKKVLDANEGTGLLRRPEDLAEQLAYAGVFKSEEERKFFLKNANNKYGSYKNYGTSLYSALQEYVDPAGKSPDDIANLLDNWAISGYKPNFSNKKDLEKFAKYEKYHNDHRDWDVMKAFGQAKGVAGALYLSLIKTGAGVGTAAGSDLSSAGMPIFVKSDPTLKWTGDFTNATGDNLKLKNEIIDILRKIRDNDPETRTQFNPAGALSLVESKKGTEEESDLDSLDPTKISEIPKLWTDLAEKVKIARERGGIANDAETNSITALTTVFSSIVGSAMDLTRLAFNPEPNSISTAIANLGIRGISLKPALYGAFTEDGAKKSWDEASLYIRAQRSWTAHRWSDYVENILNNGLVPDSYYDKRWGRDSSYVFDAFTGGKGLIKIAGKAGRMVGLFEGAAGVLNTIGLDASLARLDQLASNGVNLDVGEMLNVEQRAAFDAVKRKLETTTGKPATTIDVFKEMQINQEIETSPGVKVKIPNTVIREIASHITNKLEDTNTLRQQMLKIVGEGRLIKYTDEANGTMSNARKMLQAAVPEMDISAIPDFELYMLINDGKITFNQAAGISSAEWINASQKLKKEVGDYWRKIEENDILGYVRNGSLPKYFDGFNLYNPTGKIPWAQKLANALGYGKQLGKWALEGQQENVPIAKDARAGLRFIPTDGTQVPGQQSVNPMLNAMRQYEGFAKLAQLAGAAGDFGDFMIRFNNVVRKGKSVSGSAFLGVQAEANARIAKIDKELNIIYGNVLETSEIERANQAKAAGVSLSEMPKNEPVNVADIIQKDKRIAALLDERNMLSSHSKFGRKLHYWGGGAIEMVAEGTAHAFPHITSNELIAQLGSEHWGAGMGAYIYGTPVNYVWSKALRNFGRVNSAQERTNQDTYEIHQKLAYMPKTQQAAWLEVIVNEKRKAEAMVGTHNKEVSDRALARSLSTINQLMRMGDVEIRDDGVAEGMISILRDTQHLDAQVGRELLNQFTLDAEKLGLFGVEAQKHAQSMIDNMNEFNLSEARRGKISEEVEVLTVERDKLGEETHTNLFQHLQALRQLAADAGMDVRNLQVTPETGQILIDGRPIGETPPEIKRKLKALQDEIQLKRKMVRENRAEMDSINERIDELKKEAATLGAIKPIREYRDGEIVMSQDPDSYATRFSKGISIWMEKGNPKIILSKKYFSVERSLEETAHVLFTSMSNHEARPQIMAHLFGKYEIDLDTRKPVQVHPPSIGDSVHTNWDIMRTFAQSYADKMNNKYDAAMFMAQFNIGEANFKKNPTDYRYLYPVVMELHGNVYRQRRMMLDPWGKANSSTPMDPVRKGEQSSIQVGEGSVWKPGQDRTSLFYKVVFGNLTLNEYVSHMFSDKLGPKQSDATLGNPANAILGIGTEGHRSLSEINRVIDPNTGYTMFDAMIGFAKFTAVWSAGRGFDLLVTENTTKRLQSMGFVKNNNTSPDPSKHWKYGEIVDDRGMPVDQDPGMQYYVDVLQAHSRNLLKAPDPDALHNILDIFDNLNDQSDSAKRTRIAWANATGKQNWLERDSNGELTGNLKGTLPELTMTDIEGATQTLAMLLQDKTVSGTELTAQQYLNLKLVKGVTGKGGLVFAGTPTKAAIPDLVKWLYPKVEELNYENHAEVQHTLTLLTAIANSNIFNPESTSAGSTATFAITYNGATVGKGPTVTGSVRNSLGPQLRVITPLMFMVEETAIGKDGKVIYDASNQPLKSAQAYFYVLDNDALMARTTDAYRGKLVDSNGKKYFKPGELADKFGGWYNYNEAINLVLRNYQSAGTATGKFESLPERSWKVLLPMANGNEALARHFADVVNRAIGFPEIDFNEMHALEAKKKAKIKLTREEKGRLSELQDKFEDVEVTTEQEAMALLGATDKNELGASPMWSTRMAFCKIRADRIETMVSFQDKFGNGYFPMTANGYKFGQIAYAAGSWNPFTIQEVSKNQTNYQLGAGSIVRGVSHQSGYSVLELSYPQARGAGGKFGATRPNRIVLFDPLKNEVKSDTVFKTIDDATTFAREHSQRSNQQAGVNTVLEPKMIEAGFNPRGIEFRGPFNLRAEYYHNDGRTKIVRNKNNTFDMIDIQSGATLATDVKVSVLKGNKLPDVSNLVSAYNDANKGNTRHVKINEYRIAQLGAQYEQGKQLAEYRLILGDDGRNTKEMLFQNNPLYYEFKQKLIRSCGHAEAMKTLELMRQELGDDILSADYSGINKDAITSPAKNADVAYGATAKWIADFVDTKNWDMLEMAQEMTTTIEKENAHRSAAQVIQEARDRQKPTKPYMPKQPTEPIFGEIENDTVEDYNARTEKYAKEILAYQDAEMFGPLAEQTQMESISEMIAWTKGLINSNKKYMDIAKAQKGFIPEGQSDASRVQAALHKSKVSLMADIESGRVETYINNAGYIIQQLLYKEPNRAPIMGQQIKFTGQNNALTKFVVYNPSIQNLLIADSMEEANDAIILDILGTPEQKAAARKERIRKIGRQTIKSTVESSYEKVLDYKKYQNTK